ncbi:U3 small nucleolar RNA-associated protein 20 [Amborella trichopoda]|uniref:Uncharacterized protein n=1 Tax=Amborella trichopoda TaxID=13333 RepID=W1NVA9_AMBTC|nr:U3 small nucleolar RNA-associated protein 20 [Amborella trichopoda]ERN01577.1 hypothetical protein AMTR_s00002p00271990 [Amborella trichopoda]|eukprot:XP_006839008.1 U3 small nucleolar RNA-associated protein 20 [Amborella trichopoda]
MAASRYQPVKSLNTGPSSKRFVFKKLSERIEEIEIDVFHSLDPLKAEPSQASSFFCESLLYWRELNTAEDFITFYEEMLPLVQTLPQILLQKEVIVSKLICRLHLQARLSIEPILRLIAVLARDLQVEFVPFLQRIIESYLRLLQVGGDREPEVIEQVFTSLSYIVMHLQKHLGQDILQFLKMTVLLRYYPKDYVQEFMAEVVSFLLRNAPIKQVIKGIRILVSEVTRSTSSERKIAVSALLLHILKGPSSRLHSRAKKVIHLLVGDSIHHFAYKRSQGSGILLEVVTQAFQRLHEELEAKELDLLWNCLLEELSNCINNINVVLADLGTEKSVNMENGLLEDNVNLFSSDSAQAVGHDIEECLSHLNYLLCLITFTVRLKNETKFPDYDPLLNLTRLLTVTLPERDCKNEAVNNVLHLMLSLLDVPCVIHDPQTILQISEQLACLFQIRSSCLLSFLREIILKDASILVALRNHIMRGMNELIEDSPGEVLHLMLTFSEKSQGKLHFFNIFEGKKGDNMSNIHLFFQRTIKSHVHVINNFKSSSCSQLSKKTHESDLAILWGVLSCYHHVFSSEAKLSLLKELIDAIDQLLILEYDSISGNTWITWQSILGAALFSYQKLLLRNNIDIHKETTTFLSLAKRHKLSSHVLSAVADFLNAAFGSADETNLCQKASHAVPGIENTLEALRLFAGNLGHCDKRIRLSTLQILCHYAPLECLACAIDGHAQKKRKTEGGQTIHEDPQHCNVTQLLHLIETTSLSVSTSRKVVLLISKIQMEISAARVPEPYLTLLLHGIIGIFHNQFAHLWDPAIECLMVLVKRHTKLVWDGFVHYLKTNQSELLALHHDAEENDVDSSTTKSTDLDDQFHLFVRQGSGSTPSGTVLTLLLRSIRMVPVIPESWSLDIIPLFFKFLGYATGDNMSIEAYNRNICRGKEWRGVLKEWLNLLKLIRNPGSLSDNKILKEVLINRLLDDNDPDIQMKVVDCLLNWKDEFLLPYGLHLKNLIDPKSTREELTTWSLSKESDHIHEQHRNNLIPLIIRILVPKVRKLKIVKSRKSTGALHRRALLCFLAQLEVNELPLFFFSLLKPIHDVCTKSEGFDHQLLCSWEKSLREFQPVRIGHLTAGCMGDLPLKKISGFVHVVEDILRTFDELHIKPFLGMLMMYVVHMMESCTQNLNYVKSDQYSIVGNDSDRVQDFELRKESETVTSPRLDSNMQDREVIHEAPILDTDMAKGVGIKQSKDLRSLCLKVISFVIDKYGSHGLTSDFWDIFFVSVKPLVDSFKQEGPSSEKPSSLFSCFLAMSKTPELVHLFQREDKLVPSVFSVLSIRSASNAMISAVLSFVENLLLLFDEDSGSGHHELEMSLLPHLNTLFYNLRELIQHHKGSQRSSITGPGKMELRIFKLLAKHVKDPLLAEQFVGTLIPFLGKKALKSDDCLEILRIIQEILPCLCSRTTDKILNAAYLLLSSAGLEIRLLICNILRDLSAIDPSITSLAELLQGLNAVSATEIDEFDYDTRISCYEKIEWSPGVKESHAVVVLSHCVYDMSSEELLLRQSASRSLLSFVQFAASVLDHKAEENKDSLLHDQVGEESVPGSLAKLKAQGSCTRERMPHIIKKKLLLHIKEAMNKEIIHKEWVSLLREMVLNLHGIPTLQAFRPLCSKDLEVDFFNNILHLQKHRRARALLRFQDVICAGNFSEELAWKIFVPLFFHMLFEIKEGADEHVRRACLETLASVSGHLQWDLYFKFLMRCFRNMVAKPERQKVLLRLICSILDKFHFYGNSSNKDLANIGMESDVSNQVVIEGESSDAMIEQGISSSRVPTMIQNCLHLSVLPELNKFMNSDMVNASINLAALKLLKFLPDEVMKSQLQSIIQRIANFLKHRLESVRDEARSVLASCAKELGPEYLQFIIKILQSTLKRGYELHVLGYSVNFILSKIFPLLPVGGLDNCLEMLLSVALNDILGEVAEEKEVDKIAHKMKETRKKKSFDTLKLVAQIITFKTHVSKLLAPIKSHLIKHLNAKMKIRLESMLHHIALGLEANPFVDQTDLFVFVYGLVEDGFATGKSQAQKVSELEFDQSLSGNLLGQEYQSYNLLTVFALGILLKRMKLMKLDKNDQHLLSVMDPFIKLLQNCLSSNFEDVLSAALRCLSLLLRLPLPSLNFLEDRLTSLVLDIAQKSGKIDSPLMQSSLKLLTVLLRNTHIHLSSAELHMLIQFPVFVDIENKPSGMALSLLKAIVGRKLVVPEVYDLMIRVSELMVTSQVPEIQQKCSQVMLQFFMDYPIGSKRLQQHLDFLVSNLSYEHASGREAVLEMLHTIIMKFPQDIVDKQSEMFFFHLVLRLVNDSDKQIRTMVGTVIKVLIGRTSQRVLQHILKSTLSWFMGEKESLWGPAAQVLGLLVEVLKKGFEKYATISEILPVVKGILTSALDHDSDKEITCENGTEILFHKEAYYSLVMLEKLFVHFPELQLQKDLEEIWDTISSFLLHSHMWLRSVSTRLMATYFTASMEACPKGLVQENAQLLLQPTKLFRSAVSFCQQLEAQLTDDESNSFIAQNIVFSISQLHSYIKHPKGEGLMELWGNLPQSSQLLESMELLGSQKGIALFHRLRDKDGELCAEELQSLLVVPLLKRIGKVALQMQDIQMKLVFGCFKTISTQIDRQALGDYAIPMLLPLYKVCEGFSGKVISDEVKQLAEEVLDSMRKTLGVESFVQAYNEVRKILKAKRDKRKQQEKLVAVTDPMRHAKHKRRLAAKHQAHKKRKLLTMKMRRW